MSDRDYGATIVDDTHTRIDRETRRAMRRQPSLLRAIRGPVILITVGVLFAFNNFTNYGFDRTWPVLLIVAGLMSLVRRSIEPVVPPPPFPPPYPPQYPPPGYAYPPPPPPPTAAPGGYSQSTYAQTGPAKGGFGSSAARPADAPPENPPAPGGTQ